MKQNNRIGFSSIFGHTTPARVSTRDAAFLSTVFSFIANLLSKRYIYPVCHSHQASFIQIIKFYERPCIVPHEVMLPQRCVPGSLRRNSVFLASCAKTGSLYWSSFFPVCALLSSVIRHLGSNGSFFFISVQAIMRSFAASFTRILVPIPFSRSRPLILFVR